MGFGIIAVLFVILIAIRAKRLKQENDKIYYKEWQRVYYGSKMDGD